MTLVYHDQRSLFQRCKSSSRFKNQCNLPYEQAKGRKNCIIISIHIEIVFDKIQYPFTIKNSHKSRSGGKFSQFDKEYLQKH